MDAHNPPPPPGSKPGRYRYTEGSAALVWIEYPWWLGGLENTPLPLKMSAIETPEIPAEINMGVRRFWFLAISQLASNWEQIAKMIRQCISWIIERL